MNQPAMTILHRRADRLRGTPCRRFTMLDAMILVGGMAVELTGCRSRLQAIDLSEGWLNATYDLAGFSLMLASALVLIFRLRRPRPPVRRLAWQPGAAACFTAVAYGLLYDVDCLARRRSDWGVIFASVEEGTWFLIEAPVSEFALMIPVLWMLMILGRRWRPEPGWIDRTGRITGVGWIAWAIAAPFRY